MTSMSRSTKVTILLLHFTYSGTMYRHDRVRHPHKQQFPRICITPTATSDKTKVTDPHGKVLLCTKTFRPRQNLITLRPILSTFSLSHLTFLMSNIPPKVATAIVHNQIFTGFVLSLHCNSIPHKFTFTIALYSHYSNNYIFSKAYVFLLTIRLACPKSHLIDGAIWDS